MRKLFVCVICLFSLCGCSPESNDAAVHAGQYDKYWGQSEEMDRQLSVAKEQSERVAEQLDRTEAQLNRQEANLDRWERILQRHERVVEAMERQYEVSR